MKKFCKILIVLSVVLFACFFVSAETDGEWVYSINDDGISVSITKYTGSATEVVIPKYVGGYLVTGVGGFSSTKIVSVEIPGSVTSISDYAFRYCSSLTSIVIPNSVTSIGFSAFAGCNGLRSISLPFVGNGADKTHIGYFFGIDDFNNNSVPDSVRTITVTDGELIPNFAFYRCENVEKIIIPDTIKCIGYNAFSACHNLTDFVIPNGVEYISDSAFRFCNGLISINIPDSVKEIGDEAFYGCSNAININLPDGITSIGTSAFYGTSYYNDLTNWDSDVLLYIGQHLIKCKESISGEYSVKSNTITISDHAFDSCSNLTEVSIPKSVKNIGDFAFVGCDSLEKINIDDSNLHYCDVGGVLLSKDGKTIVVFPVAKPLKTYNIPEGVVTIGPAAFYGCNKLTSIVVPEGVTHIESYAFYKCTGITGINIPDSVVSIDNYAFGGCENLKNLYITDMAAWMSVEINSRPTGALGGNLHINGMSATEITIPDNVSEIGEFAFSCFDNIQSVVIPDHVTSINDSAFASCKGLKTVVVGNGVQRLGKNAFLNCTGLINVTLGAGVEMIDGYAFRNCCSLESISIPDSVTNIGSWAFYDCSELKNLYVTSINSWMNVSLAGYWSNPLSSGGGNLYANDCLVTEVIIPDHIKTIGYSFYDCDSIKCVVVPDSVEEIGNNAFFGCGGLESINIGKNVSKIGDHAFAYCKKLVEVNLPNAVSSIGVYAFQSCSNLKKINIPDGVSYVNAYTFDGCSSLADITIPDGVIQIQNYSFRGCTELESITFKTKDVSISSAAFDNCKGLKMIYLFKDSTADDYFSSTSYTKVYTYLITYNLNGGIGSFDTQYKTDGETVYLHSGIPMREGYTFVGWSKYGSSENYDPGDKYFENNNLLLIADWKKIKYTIYFDVGDGEFYLSSVEKEYNSNITITSTVPQREGYDFNGWSITNGGEVVYVPGDVYSENADLTLYASWTANVYVITLDANGGECEKNSVNVTFDSTYGELPVPARVGYTFICWSKSLSAADMVTKDDMYTIADNTTLYAIWEAKTFTLAFDSMGGSIDTTEKTVTFDSTYGNLPTPTLANYIFGGWFLEKDYINKITSSTIVSVADDHTVYAMWIPVNYTVLYDANGGEGAPDQQTKIFDVDIILSDVVPTRKGYIFKGWATEPDGNVVFVPGYTYSTNANITLYAVWKAINYGDPSGDGEINAVDAVLLAQVIAGWDVELDISAADCNGDGEINAIDAVLLAQFIAGWDVILG